MRASVEASNDAAALAALVSNQNIGLHQAVRMLFKPASSETNMPPEDLALWLDWLLVVRRLDQAINTSPATVLRDFAAITPQRVCSKTFSHGDVIWKCHTCQVGDDTCVVCQACFQDADHEGHDVSFYISRQADGGCCDCGDSGAWDPSGFCSRHGRLQTTPELLGSIPEAILPSAQVCHAGSG